MNADAIPLPACIQPPVARGWPALQAHLVDRIKRAALRHLHASPAGEILLLRAYIVGEEATEIALQRDLPAVDIDWLRRQIERHLAEEQGHAAVFATALAERGGKPEAHRPDIVSRWKIARWRRLGLRYGPQFVHGALVPAFAIGLCAEQMATRVLERHRAVIGDRHPMHALLAAVCADEQRHVRMCAATLARLVQPHEQAALAALLEEARAIDRAFGIVGAVAMWVAGVATRVRAA